MRLSFVFSLLWPLVWPLLGACSSAPPGAAGDGGDGGQDAGPPPVTDGGALGTACSSLYQCAGNPICGAGQTCPYAVICAADACASAGGAPAPQQVDVTFAGELAVRVPDYLQVFLLAPQLVSSGTLDCPTLLADLDGGANPTDATIFNPLLPSYSQGVAVAGATMQLSLPGAATGTGRVLLLDAYLSEAYPDGGDPFVGRGCAAFDESADGADAGIEVEIDGL